MKIFLGYPSEFEATAWQVYEFLSARGDDVWFDKKSLVAGTDWDNERAKGQREANLVVHLCSSAIFKRAGVVNREINETLRLVDDQPLGSLYVIPIRLEDFNLPVELTRFQYFDFDQDWKERLSEAVERRRSQLSGVAALPIEPPRAREGPTANPEKIKLVEVTDTFECHGEYVRYDGNGLYWDYVNAAIASAVLEGFHSFRSDFKKQPERMGAEIYEGGLKDEWSVSAEEFFRSGQMISVRFYSYAGYAGAAHPNHFITTLNFYGEDEGMPSIEELLDYSLSNARRIITYCEKVITAEFENEIDRDSFLVDFADTEEKIWRLIGQFNFNEKGLTFNFSPYDVLPYVFGSHEVIVPWRFLEELISDRYKTLFQKLM